MCACIRCTYELYTYSQVTMSLIYLVFVTGGQSIPFRSLKRHTQNNYID